MNYLNTTACKALNAWGDAYPDLTRQEQAALFNTRIRTYQRWLAGDCPIPGPAVRLLWVFKRWPEIQRKL